MVLRRHVPVAFFREHGLQRLYVTCTYDDLISITGTSLCTGRPRNLGLIPAGEDIHRSSIAHRATLTPTSPPTHYLKGLSSLGYSGRPACEAEHSPNLVSRLRISGALTLLLHTPSRRAQEEL